jgi:hypothetical protein
VVVEGGGGEKEPEKGREREKKKNERFTGLSQKMFEHVFAFEKLDQRRVI